MTEGPAPTFEPVAARYDDWCRTPLGRLTEELELAALRAAAADLAPGDSLLDIGCGTGTFAVEAVRLGARVTGIDVSPAMVDQARVKARAAGVTATFQVADAAALPFPPRSFRWVTALLVLEFASDPDAVLREAARVLAPGGTLVVATLNRWSLWTLVRRVRGLWRPSVYRKARFLSRAQIKRLLKRTGFVPEGSWGAVYYPPAGHPRLLAFYRRWEAWGRRWLPNAAAYLMVRARPGLAPPEG